MTKTKSQTRKEIIDKQLQTAGWNVDDCTQVIKELDIKIDLPDGIKEPRTKYEGHQFSDYALLGKDGKPLAVVEAKKTSKDAALDREQAKQYCYNIQKEQGGELSFCFYTDKLGLLMKIREQTAGLGPTHLDLPDTLHFKCWIEFGPQHEAVSVSIYRQMVEALTADLTEHKPVLLKIKHGEEIHEILQYTESLAA